MKQRHFTSMQEIRSALQAGQKVFWTNTSYIVIEEEIYPKGTPVGDRQRTFSAVKNDKMLVARCESNWFGGRLHDEQISQCFALVK